MSTINHHVGGLQTPFQNPLHGLTSRLPEQIHTFFQDLKEQVSHRAIATQATLITTWDRVCQKTGQAYQSVHNSPHIQQLRTRVTNLSNQLRIPQETLNHTAKKLGEIFFKCLRWLGFFTIMGASVTAMAKLPMVAVPCFVLGAACAFMPQAPGVRNIKQMIAQFNAGITQAAGIRRIQNGAQAAQFHNTLMSIGMVSVLVMPTVIGTTVLPFMAGMKMGSLVKNILN